MRTGRLPNTHASVTIGVGGGPHVNKFEQVLQ